MTDVAVIGGGVIGLASGWRAAQRGLSVTVFDPAPGSGASHAAAGMLCPVSEAHYGEESLLALAMESARRWPAFAEEVGSVSERDVGHRTDGTLLVAFDDDDLRALDELRRFQQSLGLEVDRLPSRACRKLEPHLSPRLRGGVFVAGDHQVDNRKLVAALIEACRRCGVRFESESVTRLCDVRAERVVLAAGCWSAVLDGVPVRPVKGQILRVRFDPGDAPLSHTVRALAGGRSVYLVPRADGELVIGATVEELGHDTTVTAGAVHDLLRAAVDVVPGVSELELAEVSAGLRPGTPDNAPIIGVSPHDERVVYATGHFRHGILLAPITADAVASIVAGDEPPAVVAPFGVERFQR